MDDYMDILREWEENVAKPFVYEHLDTLFPAFQFRRVNPGNPTGDHWASRYKKDLTLPKVKNAEKTVMYRSDLHLREQGDWGKGIGIMDLYMLEYGIPDIYRAYQHLDAKHVLGMPLRDGPEVTKRVKARERKTAILDELMSYFAWNLENNASAKARAVRKYLNEERGFTKEQVSRLNLGFVPEWGTVIRYITVKKGFSLEELEQACEVRNSEGKTSVGKYHTLAIPYECAGVLKGFLFRRVGEGTGPKYIACQGLDRKSAFFNIPADADLGSIVVVEGEFDALKATAEGVSNVVAIGGAEISGERRSQVEDAIRRGVKRITLCLDLDAEKDAPSKARTRERFEHVMRCVHTIKDADISFDEIYVARFPSPSDPDEYIRGNGPEAFKALIADAVPYWQYLFEYKKNS